MAPTPRLYEIVPEVAAPFQTYQINPLHEELRCPLLALASSMLLFLVKVAFVSKSRIRTTYKYVHASVIALAIQKSRNAIPIASW